MDNRAIADQLREMARQLEARRSNLYRVRAYRRAAMIVMGLDRPVEAIVDETGRKGLSAIPGIGSSLSETIESLVHTSKIATLSEEETLAAV